MRLEPSGFDFPAVFFDPGWELKNLATTVCDYRPISPGLGQGVNYRADGVLASFYVYDAGPAGRLPEDAAAKQELGNAVRDIFTAKAKGVYDSVTPLDLLGKPVDSPTPVSLPMYGSTLYFCRFRLVLTQGEATISTVMVLVKGGWFLKCRLTSAEGFPREGEFLGAALTRMKALAATPR